MKLSYTFLLVMFAFGLSWGCTSQSPSEYYLFVGTYTGEGSEGIYLYRFNSEEGTVSPVDTARGVENPSFLALSPDHRFLYAVNEMADSADARVSAFSFNKQAGDIAFINSRSSRGGAPCYVSTDKEGRAVFVGNYLGGSLAMFPVKFDGSLEPAKTVIQHHGSSINESRQQNPHVHCTLVSPDNNMLFAADLGTDQLAGYRFSSGDLSLEKEPEIRFETEKGAGPRHLTFHPNGKFAYLINELNGTVDVFSIGNDSLRHIQNVSTLPDDYEGAVSGADIHLSPDGKFLYASNREDLNNLVHYRVDQSKGTLEKAGQRPSGGIHPRNFMIDPTGAYLLVANRHTDNIVIFKRNAETGSLTETGSEIAVSQPVSLKMVPVE